MENTTERIANRLAEIFPDITIYTENQSSGFDVPSFYIVRTMTSINSRLFAIQDRTVSYQVVYFANPDCPNADMDHVHDLLADNFVRLGTYATIRNREFNLDQKEETLTVSFDILLNMYRVDDVSMQRSLDINERSKKQDQQ
ncbi:hypothetical protein GCM10022297_01130 [Lactobacillus hamsteri]|uniref:Phage protein n=1 Tax=Lactobacillus hamsteri DSM 5661 = JCM 6256 TaxID=1423754 RepID=A0A0R1YB42_9LACO|nr:hypothetical protein [Lactobacillus hamsteri]KRM37003.1 hypothetical protein FC39_GL000455 [Lactobacillus hamsteri DSM 5661 = JCM 6256]